MPKSCAASMAFPRLPSSPPSQPCRASASWDPVHGSFKAAAKVGSLRTPTPPTSTATLSSCSTKPSASTTASPASGPFTSTCSEIQPGDRILHLGCGTGYYTAILAELTGPGGKVTAIEIEEGLAARARVALEPWPQVTVIHADGSRGPFEPADVIVVSAGATHPLPAWLAAVKPSGKLLFPLTSTRGPGTMAHLTRTSADLFAATLRGSVFFVDFGGARDPAINRELAQALKRDEGAGVRSLRCDVHAKDDSCWLHGNGWCFSRLTAIAVERV